MSGPEPGHGHAHFYFSASAKERTEFLMREMPALKEYIKDRVVADIGAGDGSLTRILAGHARIVYAIEVDAESLKALEENCRDTGNVSAKLAKPDKLPLRDRSVDMVFSSASFHHFPEGYEKEISRALKAKGIVMILDWKKNRAPLFMRLRHRLFSADEVVRIFEGAGFIALKRKEYKSHYLVVLSS